VGQKAHPRGLRLGIIETWDSRWFAPRKQEYGRRVAEDMAIRALLMRELPDSGVAKIAIERFSNRVNVTIHTSRPGIVIGKKGANIDELVKKLKRVTHLEKRDIKIDIEEISRPELCAQLVANQVASQLEKRIPFRRAMRQAIQYTMKSGALGIKIMCAGRLGGAEIARTEWLREGRVPLHTLRAQIDYALGEANTKYGRIGIKVWIFLGEKLPEMSAAVSTAPAGQ